MPKSSWLSLYIRVNNPLFNLIKIQIVLYCLNTFVAILKFTLQNSTLAFRHPIKANIGRAYKNKGPTAKVQQCYPFLNPFKHLSGTKNWNKKARFQNSEVSFLEAAALNIAKLRGIYKIFAPFLNSFRLGEGWPGCDTYHVAE